MRFHLDEHLDPAIAVALRRDNIDVTTTSEAGLLAADDGKQLDYCQRAGRIMVTMDADFLRLASAGAEHPGIVYFHRRHSRAAIIIACIKTIVARGPAHDLRNRVEFGR